MRRLLLVLAFFSTPAMAAEQQFDLICKGKGFETRYRVDLDRNEACSGKCERVWKMGEPTSGQLKLIDKVPAYEGDLEERATVNRASGAYRYDPFANGRTILEDGRCEKAPFSGFPPTKF